MIAYFDTSAIVPLLIEEHGTASARDIWSSADRMASVRLARVEAGAALAKAARMGRITAAQLRSSVQSLDDVMAQLHLVELDEHLVCTAGDLAESESLRAYDAVHLAAALQVSEPDLVFVAGDRALLAAGISVGLNIAEV